MQWGAIALPIILRCLRLKHQMIDRVYPQVRPPYAIYEELRLLSGHSTASLSGLRSGHAVLGILDSEMPAA
jgi:hypothetical protein